MAIEDFTTYTLFDLVPVGYSIDSDSKVSSNITAIDEGAMVFDDKGAGAFPFGDSFTHLGEFILRAGGNFPVIYNLSQHGILDRGTTRAQTPTETDGEVGGVNGDCLCFFSAGTAIYIDAIKGGDRNFLLLGSVSLNVRYYTKYEYDATAQDFTATVYSDLARTIPILTGTRTHPVTNDKRWITALGTFGFSMSASQTEVFDLDLGITPPVTGATRSAQAQQVGITRPARASGSAQARNISTKGAFK